MSDSGHVDVAFANTVVAGDEIDLTGWECWTHPDGEITHYYAHGPCPVCHAHSQGHISTAAHPIEPLGPDVSPSDTPSEPIEIPVRCACGQDHGRQGATGCGRRWSILCSHQRL